MGFRWVIYATAGAFGLSLWYSYGEVLSTKEGILYDPESGEVYTVELGARSHEALKWKHIFFLEEVRHREIRWVKEELGALQEIISENDPYVIDLREHSQISIEEGSLDFVSVAFLPDHTVSIDTLLPVEWQELEASHSLENLDIVGGHAIFQKTTFKGNGQGFDSGEPKFAGPLLKFGPASSRLLKEYCLSCFADSCWSACLAEASVPEQIDHTNLNAWKAKNSDWYQVIPEMTRYAYEVDKIIRDEGIISIGSSAYFSEIDQRMQQRFPNFFSGER